ncbi:MAG: IclR family transcriptional regulator [Parvibaculaceae bacterium]
MTKTPPSGSTLHALAILESFDVAHVSQSLTVISRRLGIPKATALRILRALEERRYVFRNPHDGSYSLSFGVLALAQRYLAEFEILTILRPVLAELAAETGETAHFGVLQETEVVYLDIAESPQRVRAYVLRGDNIPAHCVAAGKAILAHAERSKLEHFLAADRARLTPATIVDRDQFLDELEQTRRRGYALNMGEWMPDVTGVSAPVFSRIELVAGAVGVAGPISRLDLARAHHVGEIVRRYAAKISEVLGGLNTARPGTPAAE